MKTSPPLVGRLARFWRRHYFSQCCSEAAHGYLSVSCTRRRGHESYDPVHFNVVFEVAWREGEQVPYPTDALRRAGVDRGRRDSLSDGDGVASSPANPGGDR